jgi:hypothetical protein
MSPKSTKGKQILPTRVMVLGKVFNVEYVKNLKDEKEELYGETLGRDFIIKINSSHSDAVQRATLVHEMIHAGLSVAGLDHLLAEELEETVVSCMESILAHAVNVNLFAVEEGEHE